MTSLSVALTTPTELDAWERTVECCDQSALPCSFEAERPDGSVTLMLHDKCGGSGRVPDPSVSRWYVADRAVETLHLADWVKCEPHESTWHDSTEQHWRLAVVASVPVLEALPIVGTGDCSDDEAHICRGGFGLLLCHSPLSKPWPDGETEHALIDDGQPWEPGNVALRLGTPVRLEHPIVEMVCPEIDECVKFYTPCKQRICRAPLPSLKPHEIQTIEVP